MALSLQASFCEMLQSVSDRNDELTLEVESLKGQIRLLQDSASTTNRVKQEPRSQYYHHPTTTTTTTATTPNQPVYLDLNQWTIQLLQHCGYPINRFRVVTWWWTVFMLYRFTRMPKTCILFGWLSAWTIFQGMVDRFICFRASGVRILPGSTAINMPYPSHFFQTRLSKQPRVCAVFCIPTCIEKDAVATLA